MKKGDSIKLKSETTNFGDLYSYLPREVCDATLAVIKFGLVYGLKSHLPKEVDTLKGYMRITI